MKTQHTQPWVDEIGLSVVEPIGPRFMWWNFVSSRRERIEQAADDWAALRMGRVPGDDEFIPLPARPARA